MTQIQVDTLESPIGTIRLAVWNGALCALDFDDRAEIMQRRLEARFGTIESIPSKNPAGHTERLRAYIDGDVDALDDIAVEPGGTEFQRRVWTALRGVKSGATRSYSEIADEIGAPGAARAVGTANGRNPIALVIPCHRIVTKSRTLGGYAGGLERKSWLLSHEGADIEAEPQR
jgi:methylated-DNA-[protein]-cysteine S-methyltransferase